LLAVAILSDVPASPGSWNVLDGKEVDMPLVRITYPRGALTPARKRDIAASLTDIVLDAEVDAVTDMGRMVTVIHFQEVAADDWAVAGVLRSSADAAAPDHFVVDVVVLEGLLEGARRTDVHRRSWGAGGQTVSALDVAQFINWELDAARRAEIEEFLASRSQGS
jgi:phenylpyruvate tautomerase PptA (4-oxalocrotonate tautomerase family)